jgi:hypothetical protein
MPYGLPAQVRIVKHYRPLHICWRNELVRVGT